MRTKATTISKSTFKAWNQLSYEEVFDPLVLLNSDPQDNHDSDNNDHLPTLVKPCICTTLRRSWAPISPYSLNAFLKSSFKSRKKQDDQAKHGGRSQGQWLNMLNIYCTSQYFIQEDTSLRFNYAPNVPIHFQNTDCIMDWEVSISAPLSSLAMCC